MRTDEITFVWRGSHGRRACAPFGLRTLSNPPLRQPQPTTTERIQLRRRKSPRPALFIIFTREIIRRNTLLERPQYVAGITPVFRAHGRRRYVHDVAPALLIFHRCHAVD